MVSFFLTSFSLFFHIYKGVNQTLLHYFVYQVISTLNYSTMAQPVASFLCPITLELMKEPMIDPDGNTYERSAIEDWLKKTRPRPS